MLPGSRWGGKQFRLFGIAENRTQGPLDSTNAPRGMMSLRCPSFDHLVGSLDLPNGEGRGLGLAHRVESALITDQKAPCARRKIIEATELVIISRIVRLGLPSSFLGDMGAEVRGHGLPFALVGVHAIVGQSARLMVDIRCRD
jgi:hypothetical protein